MSKSYRYSLIVIAIITAINFFFTMLTTFIGLPMSHFVIVKICLALIGSLLSAIVVTYLIISTSPVAKDFLQTFRRLTRLESLSHPLLVKFSQIAPGTYHHTMNVANIASRAAKSIGANSLLTRVASYYHDIGKMDNPEHFVENQQKDNTHDEIDDPNESTKIIINHVTKGVEIAENNHLPQEIIDCIQQHHGTSVVAYFYEKAKALNLDVKKSDFRYSGPKPMSKEAGILMLADSIEATLRSANKPNAELIKNVIDHAISERQAEGQLSLTGLTAANLTKIRQSFLESLSAIFHQRIDYKKASKVAKNK